MSKVKAGHIRKLFDLKRETVKKARIQAANEEITVKALCERILEQYFEQQGNNKN